MSGQSEKQAVLEFFNLDPGMVESVIFHNENGTAVVDIFLQVDYPSCPDCGCFSPRTIRSRRSTTAYSPIANCPQVLLPYLPPYMVWE